MAKAELLQLCLAFDIPKPASGSGKNGNILKLDLATAVVSHFFGERSDEEQAAMIRGIMGTSRAMPDIEILEHVALLDPENAESFKKQKAEAELELERIIKRKAVVEEEEQRYEKAIPDVVATSDDPKKATFDKKEEEDYSDCSRLIPNPHTPAKVCNKTKLELIIHVMVTMPRMMACSPRT